MCYEKFRQELLNTEEIESTSEEILKDERTKENVGKAEEVPALPREEWEFEPAFSTL